MLLTKRKRRVTSITVTVVAVFMLQRKRRMHVWKNLHTVRLVSVFQDFGSDDDRKNNQRYELFSLSVFCV